LAGRTQERGARRVSGFVQLCATDGHRCLAIVGATISRAVAAAERQIVGRLMHEDLLHLIREYQKRTREACELLRSHLHLDNPMLWRASDIPQVGDLGEGARYAFHGTGVSVTTSSGSINFDFGHDGRAVGFSPWKLADVAQQLGGVYLRFSQWQKLKEDLDLAVAEGWVHRPFLEQQDDLYYLATTPN
jgi:hypothetical protein